MFLILCVNQSDPFCGTEFIMCDNMQDVFKELVFIPKNEVFHIYNIDKTEDIKEFFI